MTDHAVMRSVDIIYAAVHVLRHPADGGIRPPIADLRRDRRRRWLDMARIVRGQTLSLKSWNSWGRALRRGPSLDIRRRIIPPARRGHGLRRLTIRR
jgi:hypothetical protein